MRMPMRCQKGLTLIEMLVVVGMVGVVMGIGLSLLMQADKLFRMQDRQAMQHRDSWVWTARIAKDLRSALPPSAVGAGAEWSGTDAAVSYTEALPVEAARVDKEFQNFDLSADSIRFPIARVTGEPGYDGPGVVEYSLKRGKDNEVLGLVRKVAHRGASLAEAPERLISPRIVSLDFEYLGPDGQWAAAWTTPTEAPKAVRMTLGVVIRREKISYPQNFTTMVALPAEMRITQ